MPKLSATFTTDPSIGIRALAECEKLAGRPSKTSIVVPARGAGFDAIGPAQEVMVLIGRIADHGEDGLAVARLILSPVEKFAMDVPLYLIVFTPGKPGDSRYRLDVEKLKVQLFSNGYTPSKQDVDEAAAIVSARLERAQSGANHA